MTDTADGAAAGLFQKLSFGPRKKINETGVIQSVPDCEVLLCRGAREFVPRTDQLTIIAAIDAVADGRAKFFGDGA